MVVSAQYAAEHFDELEAAVDRGEKVEIARDARASLHLVPPQLWLIRSRRKAASPA